MKSKVRKSRRRVKATGRSIGGDGHHARCYRWELNSPTYRSLSVGARALLLEFKSLCNGSNNGPPFLSVREGARRIGTGKNYAAKCFVQLQDRRFHSRKK